jgi:serine/threonine-protein kinase
MSASLGQTMHEDIEDILPAWRTAQPALLPGQRIGDRWTLDALLGEGAFGAVWLARSSAGKPVAIKLFRKREDSGFIRELNALLGVEHPHIVGLRDFGYLAQQRYIVYDYIPGGSLRALLHERQTLSVQDTLAIIADITRGLVFAHDRKIVHRDLKPENILLSANAAPFQARIADFGLATSTPNAGVHTRSRFGTPGYAAPEMIDGPHDRRADLYALGVILHECLLGRRPFDGDSQAIYRAQRERPVTFPRTLHPLLRHILQRLLHASPDARYQEASDVLRDVLLTQAAIQSATPHIDLDPPNSITQRWERQLPALPHHHIITQRGDLLYAQADGIHAQLREGQHLHLVHTRQPIRAIVQGSAVAHTVAWEAHDKLWIMERGVIRQIPNFVVPQECHHTLLLPGGQGFVVATVSAIELRLLDGSLRRTITLPSCNTPPDLHLSANSQTLWATCGNTAPHLLAFSIDGTPRAHLPICALPLAMVSAADGGLIFGSWGRKQLRRIGPDGAELGVVALTERLTDLFDLGHNTLAAASQDTLTLLDATTLHVLATLPRPASTHAATLFARGGLYLLSEEGLGARLTYYRINPA